VFEDIGKYINRSTNFLISQKTSAKCGLVLESMSADVLLVLAEIVRNDV